MRNYLKKTILLISVAVLSSFNLSAQENQSIFDEMTYAEVLDVTITTDLEAIRNKRSKEKHKATMSFIDATGSTQHWDIKLAVRGKFRRMRCSEIPPLKIHFYKSDLSEAGLAKFDDLKLVNQCMEDENVGTELLLKEYLAYELYNQITPESFRVQFLNITYKDVSTEERLVRSGFVIEDAAQLRDRIGATKATQKAGFEATQFNQKQFQTMALFQYWIGNSDWSAIFGRNIKVLEKNNQLIAIPYDFDFSGMVDAPYAIPNVNFGLTSIQQRAYLGFEKKVEELESAVKELVAMRSSLRKVVKKHELLSRVSRNRAWTYLDAYFDEPNTIVFGKEKKVEVLQIVGTAE